MNAPPVLAVEYADFHPIRNAFQEHVVIPLV